MADTEQNNDFKSLNTLLKYCQMTSTVGLKFGPPDHRSTSLTLFTEFSFANTNNLKSQIEYILALGDESNRANIIHYKSSRCKPVCQSLIAAEILALVYGIESTYAVRFMIEEIIVREFRTGGSVDSKTLFDIIAESAARLEKKLQIDVLALRQIQEISELKAMSWKAGAQIETDILKKFLSKPSNWLRTLMTKAC